MSAKISNVPPGTAAELESLYDEALLHCRHGSSLQQVQQGIRLLEQASAGGLAKASEHLAVFRCVGVARAIDWRGALEFLGLAADQGSEKSIIQLAVMTGARPDQLAGNCRTAARSISLNRLLGAPEVQLLSASPRIGVIEQFASPAECAWLIQAAQPRLVPSTVFDHETGDLRKDSRRTNRYTPVDPLVNGVLLEVIRSRLSRAIGLPLAHFEMSQVLHYAVGQEFKPHHDYFDPSSAAYKKEMAKQGQRVATQLIYLNQDYEGGETLFPSLGIGYRGRTGDSLMFFNINERGEPEPLTLHSGVPPTTGEKWTFSQWIRDKRPQQPS